MRSNSLNLLSRRDAIGASTLLAASQSSRALQGPRTVAPPNTVRDRLWLWSHVAGSYNGMFNLPGNSRMTPAEAAFYMSIPNIFMLHRNGTPEPPLEQYAWAFEPLREVVWGIVGEAGTTQSTEREMVLKLALHNPKITGVVMDDFFMGGKDGKVSALTLEQVRELKDRLKSSGKSLDLWVVLYEHQLDDRVVDYLKLCDVVQLWTWYGQNLKQLRSNFEKAKKLAGSTRMALGLYWWDFGNKRSLPISLMRSQCETGLELLHEGSIEAMIFCGSWLCDRGLETVSWTREWIQEVGGQKAVARRTG
jgi:hypothetical protein